MLKKLVLPFLLTITVTLIIFYLAPNNIVTVGLLIFFLSSLCYLLLAVFAKKKYAFISSLFLLIFFLINYLAGFSLTNMVILISLLISLILLLK